jgi:hypothetical protein
MDAAPHTHAPDAEWAQAITAEIADWLPRALGSAVESASESGDHELAEILRAEQGAFNRAN